MENKLWGGFGGDPEAGSVTARGLIYGALRLLTVLRPGQTASPESMADGLAAFNDLIESWSNERLLCWAEIRTEYSASAGEVQLAIGRPVRILRAARLEDGIETPIEVLTPERWAAIAEKSLSGPPMGIHSDNQVASAAGYLWPVPDRSYGLVLYTWEPFTGFADLEAAATFPPGWALALKYALAVAIAPMFTMLAKSPAVLLESIDRQAARYKAKIKSVNARAPRISSDVPQFGRRGSDFNYRTGQ